MAISSDTFKDQEFVAQGRLDIEYKRLFPSITNHVWDESNFGVPWNHKPNSISMHTAATTVYERYSQ